MNYLQPYRGNSTRHTCPSCGRKHSFTLYLNGQTHEPIHRTVGRCNREIKCGYHYTPKQYFTDNPELNNHKCKSFSSPSHLVGLVPTNREGFRVRSLSPLSSRRGVGGEVPFHYLKNSLSPRSNFVSFLQKHFSEEQINTVFEKYLLGATKNKEVIFWQIDIKGKVRTGKIMQYNPETGKRIKHQRGAINWVHNKLKQKKQLPDDFNLQQCFFGEHLISNNPDSLIAIVESEKTAVIATIMLPEYTWLAAGSLNGLSLEKCRVLANRKVILYPDQGAFEKWSEKALEICQAYDTKISVSHIIQKTVSHEINNTGIDIADLLRCSGSQTATIAQNIHTG